MTCGDVISQVPERCPVGCGRSVEPFDSIGIGIGLGTERAPEYFLLKKGISRPGPVHMESGRGPKAQYRFDHD